MGSSYDDVMNMSTNKRRYFIGLLLKAKEQQENKVNNSSVSGGKGKRKSTISGDRLKHMQNNNKIPFK